MLSILLLKKLSNAILAEGEDVRYQLKRLRYELDVYELI
jgi:hypothetical protein